MQFGVLVTVLSITVFCAQAVHSETFTVQQLVEIAMQNSSLEKANELESKSKAELVNQAGVWENPNFQIGSEVKDEVGGSTRSIKYGLSQSFYLPGKYSARKRVFQADADIGKIELASNTLTLRSRIWSLIYEYKAAKEKLSHADERLGRIKTAQSFLKSRVFAAPQKKAEAGIVTAKLIVLQKEQLHIQVQKESLWNDLNLYLQLSTEPEIKSEWYVKAPQLSKAELMQQLSTSNPEVKIQNSRLVQSREQLGLAKVDAWPGFNISGNYSEGSGLNPEKVYGLGVSIPLTIFNINTAGKASAGLQVSSQEAKQVYVQAKVLKDFKVAFLNYEMSKKLVTSLPVKKINELEKAIRDTDRDFKRGQVDLLTYLESDSQHFESLSAILEAQVELVKSISDIQILTGRNDLMVGN